MAERHATTGPFADSLVALGSRADTEDWDNARCAIEMQPVLAEVQPGEILLSAPWRFGSQPSRLPRLCASIICSTSLPPR